MQALAAAMSASALARTQAGSPLAARLPDGPVACTGVPLPLAGEESCSHQGLSGTPAHGFGMDGRSCGIALRCTVVGWG